MKEHDLQGASLNDVDVVGLGTCYHQDGLRKYRPSRVDLVSITANTSFDLAPRFVEGIGHARKRLRVQTRGRKQCVFIQLPTSHPPLR